MSDLQKFVFYMLLSISCLIVLILIGFEKEIETMKFKYRVSSFMGQDKNGIMNDMRMREGSTRLDLYHKFYYANLKYPDDPEIMGTYAVVWFYQEQFSYDNPTYEDVIYYLDYCVYTDKYVKPSLRAEAAYMLGAYRLISRSDCGHLNLRYIENCTWIYPYLKKKSVDASRFGFDRDGLFSSYPRIDLGESIYGAYECFKTSIDYDPLQYKSFIMLGVITQRSMYPWFNKDTYGMSSILCTRDNALGKSLYSIPFPTTRKDSLLIEELGISSISSDSINENSLWRKRHDEIQGNQALDLFAKAIENIQKLNPGDWISESVCHLRRAAILKRLNRNAESCIELKKARQKFEHVKFEPANPHYPDDSAKLPIRIGPNYALPFWKSFLFDSKVAWSYMERVKKTSCP